MEIRTQKEELVFSAKTGCGDRSALGQAPPTAGVLRREAIGHIRPFQDRSHSETGGLLGGKIFETVDGHIDLAAEESLLEFLSEETFFQRTGRGEAHIEALVAGRFNDSFFRNQIGMSCAQAGGHLAGLNECQIASACSKNHFFHRMAPG